jgi:hypothetical protein
VTIPGRVSDVVRSLAGSGVAAAVASFCLRAGCSVDSGWHLSQPANSLNITGSTAWVLAQPTSERAVSGFVNPDDFERSLNRYPARTGAGNKVAVT